jgi:hypothetical protein
VDSANDEMALLLAAWRADIDSVPHPPMRILEAVVYLLTVTQEKGHKVVSIVPYRGNGTGKRVT